MSDLPPPVPRPPDRPGPTPIPPTGAGHARPGPTPVPGAVPSRPGPTPLPWSPAPAPSNGPALPPSAPPTPPTPTDPLGLRTPAQPLPPPLGLETPAAPLPSPFEEPAAADGPMAVPAEDLVPRAGLLPAFRAGLAHAWRCRVPLLLVLVAQVVFGATVALPLHARWKASLATHAHAPALGGHPDALDAAAGVPGAVDGVLLRDLRRVDAPFHEGLSLAFAWVCLAAWVFGAFAAGGFLATADAPPRPFGRRVESWRFLEGGGRWFWRCLRVSLGFAVAYALLGRLLLEAWPAAVERAERDAVSDVVRFRGPIVREAAFLVGFLLLRTIADVARARVVVLRRRSAVLALFRSATSVARHPLRTVGLVVLSGALEALLLLAAWALLSVADTGSALDVSIAFLAFQAAVLFRWGARAVCLGGLVHLQHAHAGLPLREPDPDRRARRAPVPAPAA